jgi:transcriptional regulator with XRE-family HTH domain
MRNATKSDDIALGARIRHNRLRQRISQDQLAKKLGLTQQQVQKYEDGVTRVSAARLIRIAKALGLSVGSLLGEASQRPRNRSQQTLGETTEVRLLDAFRGVKDGRLKIAIIRLIEHINAR